MLQLEFRVAYFCERDQVRKSEMPNIRNSVQSVAKCEIIRAKYVAGGRAKREQFRNAWGQQSTEKAKCEKFDCRGEYQ